MRKILFILFIFVCFMFLGCGEKEPSSYELTFVDYNGGVITEVVYTNGQDIVMPEGPQREGYIFMGWDIDLSNVNSDVTVKGIYVKNVYKVNFYNGDILVKTIDVEHGDNCTYSGDKPTTPGGIFKGWDHELKNITSDTDVHAIYEYEKYYVKYYEDGRKVFEEEVEYGQGGTYQPEKEGYVAVFDKDISVITEDTKVNITYEIKKLEVKFTFNGELLATKTVKYGDSLTSFRVEVPGYYFVKWSKDLSKVTEDMSVNGLYEPYIYAVNFELGDSKSEESSWNNKTEFVNEFYGDFLEYLTSHASSLSITVEGSKLTLSKNGVTISFSSVEEMLAIDLYDFEKTLGTLIYAPCTRVNDNPITPLPNEDYFLNSSKYLKKYAALDAYFLNCIKVSYSSYSNTYTPTSAGKVQIFFRFHQWATGGANIVPFNTIPVKYTVSSGVNAENPNTVSTFSVTQTIDILDATSSEGVFLGWYDNELFEGEPVKKINGQYTSNVTLYARWDTDENSNEIIFVGANNVELGRYTVENGKTVEAPTANELEGFKFLKWNKDFSSITTDMTVSAVYEPINYKVIYNMNAEGVENLKRKNIQF